MDILQYKIKITVAHFEIRDQLMQMKKKNELKTKTTRLGT